MSSRHVDLDISKLRIYFLTNAIFISGILNETLLSTFESTNFFIYSILESCIRIVQAAHFINKEAMIKRIINVILHNYHIS